MGLFTKKTPDQIAADKAEKERKRKENEAQKVIYRDAYNKARREALAIEGEKKGKLSAQKSNTGIMSGLGSALTSLSGDQAQQIGRNANSYILDGLDDLDGTRRKRHG